MPRVATMRFAGVRRDLLMSPPARIDVRVCHNREADLRRAGKNSGHAADIA